MRIWTEASEGPYFIQMFGLAYLELYISGERHLPDQMWLLKAHISPEM